MMWSDNEFGPLFRSVYSRLLRAAHLTLGDRASAQGVAREAFARHLARGHRPID